MGRTFFFFEGRDEIFFFFPPSKTLESWEGQLPVENEPFWKEREFRQ